MNDVKKKISPLELHTSILVYMVATSVYNNYLHSTGKHNVWISAIISIFIGLFYVFIYISLSSIYPNKTIIKINDIIFGRYIGKLISVIYIFVFSAMLLDTMVWSSFLLEESIAPDSSRIFAIILITVFSLIAIKNGIQPVIRYALVLVVLGYVVLGVTYVLLLKDMDFSNLLPIDVPIKDILKGSLLHVDYTYGESIYFFLIIFPGFNNIKNILHEKKKYVYFTVIFGGLFTILAFVRNAAIIGNLSILYRYYYLNVVRNIEIGEARLELLFILENISFLFFF
ncbi:MAG: spore germination protein, partial [Clostridia bacterium]|nr:spore germination protein [Clostridia bacterium]